MVIFSLVGWLTTGYHVVGRELRIQDGLLWRRNRAIPLERLQAVELRRPLLAQLTGLAELRLEVVGGSKTEAPLAYLTVRDAAALRERLLALAGRTAGAAERHADRRRPAAPGAPALERPLLRVSNRDLVISQLLTPQAFFLPIGVAFVVMQFVLGGHVDLHRHRQHGHRDGRCAAATGAAGPAGLGLPAGPRPRRPAGGALRPAGDAQPGGAAATGCSRSG